MTKEELLRRRREHERRTDRRSNSYQVEHQLLYSTQMNLLLANVVLNSGHHVPACNSNTSSSYSDSTNYDSGSYSSDSDSSSGGSFD